jgi:cyanophycin synthetase
MAAHLAEGESGVFVENGMIVVATGDQRIELVELERVPFTYGGKVDFQVMNALAATAAAWAAGLNPAMIVRALTTFQSDVATVPGRFNHFELNGVDVIIDYAHNPAALKALGQAVQALPPRHTIMALTLPGDRRDKDLLESGTATLPYADSYVLFDATDRRGRAVNEVPMLLRDQLFRDKETEIAPGEDEAVRQAWRRARPGDRLIIICDEAEKTMAALLSLAESRAEDSSCDTPRTPESTPVARRGQQNYPAPHGISLPPGKKPGSINAKKQVAAWHSKQNPPGQHSQGRM